MSNIDVFLRKNKIVFVGGMILFLIVFFNCLYFYFFNKTIKSYNVCVLDYLIFQLQNKSYFLFIIPLMLICCLEKYVKKRKLNILIRFIGRRELWISEILDSLFISILFTVIIIIGTIIFSSLLCKNLFNWNTSDSIIWYLFKTTIKNYSFLKVIIMCFIINELNLLSISILFQTLFWIISDKIISLITILILLFITTWFGFNIFITQIKYYIFINDFQIINCLPLLCTFIVLLIGLFFSSKKEFYHE